MSMWAPVLATARYSPSCENESAVIGSLRR
jgi:hypothetical protein